MDLPHKIVQNIQFLFIFSIVSPFGQQTQLLKVSSFSFRNVKDFKKNYSAFAWAFDPTQTNFQAFTKVCFKASVVFKP